MAPLVRNFRDSARLRRLAQHNSRVARVVETVRQKHLTYLEVPALCDLADLVTMNEAKQIKGIIVEAGCALGGSAVVMASAKSRNRPFFIYDVFDMIPPPSQYDGADVHDRYRIIASGGATGIDGQRYYGYESNLYALVAATMTDFGLDLNADNIHLVKGLYQDSMHINSPVALAHIDCDWYDSVFTCLKQIAPNLSPGGTIVVDDYYVWSGCRRAVDEYFANTKKSYRFVTKSRLHIVKV